MFRNDQGGKDEAQYPASVGGLKVTSVRDLTTGFDSSNPPHFKPSLPLSSGHMIQFSAQNSSADIQIHLTIRLVFLVRVVGSGF